LRWDKYQWMPCFAIFVFISSSMDRFNLGEAGVPGSPQWNARLAFSHTVGEIAKFGNAHSGSEERTA
jgi:hypothetical protein